MKPRNTTNNFCINPKFQVMFMLILVTAVLIPTQIFALHSWEFFSLNVSNWRPALPDKVTVRNLKTHRLKLYRSDLNLDEILKPFKIQRCLIVLDNYANIDIGVTNIALINRFPKPFEVDRYSSRNRLTPIRNIIWSPHDVTLSKYDNPELAYNCYRSKFMNSFDHRLLIVMDHPPPVAYCLQLNSQCIFNSKPWTCQVHLDAYFPMLDVSRRSFPLQIFDPIITQVGTCCGFSV